MRENSNKPKSKHNIKLNTNDQQSDLQPFLKWAGGKRQLLAQMEEYLPSDFNCYYEAFLGGGALFFYLKPKQAIINDINFELINCYLTIKTSVYELIDTLKKHENESDYFYKIRNWDRLEIFTNMSLVERAARTIYLNKTCFNGLYRVNKQGYFNVPFGRYKNPQFVNEEKLIAIHKYLNDINNKITITNLDFAKVLEKANKNDFVYLDPPYDPLSATAAFTKYNSDGFNRDEQVRLKDTFSELTQRGVKVLLSNSKTDFIMDLYKDFDISTVKAKRSINSKGNKRNAVDEVLIKNYSGTHISHIY